MKKFKKQALLYYKRWRKEKTYCPALKSYIRISLKGWNHLVGNAKYKKRTYSDVYRRLKLLPQAKKIIKTSTTIQNIFLKNNKKYYALEAILPVTEKNKTTLRKIRVIIEEDKQEKKVFLSVMDKKTKRLTLKSSGRQRHEG